ncbi:MAG: hypothetical protein HY320_06800 [Armatimonadetes bacterium]|nr:hypothetical protein [Armatimonadota bacterium]
MKMHGDVLLGIDIGATGIKVGAFDPQGQLVAVAARSNGPRPQTTHDPRPSWLIWDADEIWGKVCEACREVRATLGDARIRGVATTGFGCDGVPLDARGERLYPFISWHCGRTRPQREETQARLGAARLYQIAGYHNYAINTLNRLLWFRQERPDILERATLWLQMQDYIAFRLSGQAATDITIASTTMALDLAERRWSDELLRAVDVDPGLFAPLRESGTVVGEITAAAATQTGLPAGTPVVTGGHDCEIATLGSGVNDPATLVDITGTWEIILALLDRFTPEPAFYDQGLDFECHAVPGQYICQGLMIAGGVLEWLRARFYPESFRDGNEGAYEEMFGEADAWEPGAGGVFVLPSFMRGMGPAQKYDARGTCLGLTTVTERGQLVRATLEGLCFQLRQQVAALEVCAGASRKLSGLRVVGGGQKNPLWVQLKADVTGLPAEVPGVPEITLLGAAILAGVGAGVYQDVDDALATVQIPIVTTEPRPGYTSRYVELYEGVYQAIAPGLEQACRGMAAVGL